MFPSLPVLLLILTMLELVSSSMNTHLCVHSNASSSITDCTVRYNQSIELVCPKKGFWTKGGDTLSVPASYVLTLPIESIGQDKITFVNNNGIYTCQYTEEQLYRFNVTVYGPPEFVSNSTRHIYVPDKLQYSWVTTSDEHKYGTLVVQVVGNGGPFTVQWSVNGEDACKLKHVVCSEEKISETSVTFTYQIPTAFYKKEITNNYRSTVTDKYGSSYATTYLEYQCSSPGYKPVNVLPIYESTSVTFMNGSLLSLPCVAIMYYSNDYGMCYGVGNDTFESVFDMPGRCAVCKGGEECYTNFTGITGSVERYHSNECNTYGIVLNLTQMAQAKDLTFYCFWYRNDYGEGGYFASYEVSFGHPTHVPLRVLLGSLFACVLLLVVMVIVTVLVMCTVRKRRTESIKIEKDSETTPIVNVLDNDPINGTNSTEVQSVPYYENTDGLHDVTSTRSSVLYYGSISSLNTTQIELPNDPNSHQQPV